jgi:hypothetical protein
MEVLTKQSLTNHENNEARGKEGYEDEGNDHGHARHDRFAKSKPLAYIPSCQKADELTNSRSIAQASLPRSRDLIRVGLYKLSVCFSKGRLGEQSTDQLGIISFHDNRGGHDDAPKYTLGI